MCNNISDLYCAMVESVDSYRYSKLQENPDPAKSCRTLVLRIHVGESNMSESKFDREKEKTGRRNVSVILTAINKLISNGKYNIKKRVKRGNAYRNVFDNKVQIRLGHITALTIGQARWIIQNQIRFEINSLSNLRTFAAEDEGHLPIIKILIANAICIYEKGNDMELEFTCNTDGNGVMRSNITEEYELNAKLVESFVEQKTLANGIRPTVYIFTNDHSKGCVDTSDIVAIKDVVKNSKDFEGLNRIRTIEFYHFSEDFQKILKDEVDKMFILCNHPMPPELYSEKKRKKYMARRVDVHKANLKAMGYDSLEHWLKNPKHVYVGRNMVYVKGARQHEFANRFSAKKYGRDGCLRRYKTWLIDAIKDNEVMARLEGLKGKTLGCWCRADEACHADVIIRLLDEVQQRP